MPDRIRFGYSEANRVSNGSVAGSATILMLASIYSMVATATVNVVLARSLGPYHKGIVDVYLNSIDFIATVFGLSLASGITYVIAKGGVNIARLAIVLSLGACVQSVVIYVSVVVLVKIGWVSQSLVSRNIAAIVAVAGISTILIGYWRAIIAGSQQFRTVAFLDLATRSMIAIPTIAAAALFWSDRERASFVAIAGSMTALLILAVSSPFVMFRRLSVEGSSTRIAEIYRYSKPCYWANLAQFCNYRLDVFLVAYFIGTRDVALYVAAVSVSQLLWLPCNAIASVLLPRIAGMADTKRRAEEAAQMSRVCLCVTLVMGLMLAVFASQLMSVLFGREFVPSALPFLVLLPGTAAFSCVTVLAAYVAAIGKPRINLAISCFSLAVTLVLNPILLPRIGMIGAAITSTFSYIFSAILTMKYFQRETGIPLAKALFVNREDIHAGREWLVKIAIILCKTMRFDSKTL